MSPDSDSGWIGCPVFYWVGFFDIVGQMKGHVGGGPGSDGFKASGTRLKQAVPICLNLHIHSECNCAGMAP
jgi:hypothetical protein